MPDKNLMKFKKADNQLYNKIDELLTSEKYYKNGDLGIKYDGTMLDGSHTGDYTYFCETLAELFSTKSVNCLSQRIVNGWNGYVDGINDGSHDPSCKAAQQANVTPEIITSDGIFFYRVNPMLAFGAGQCSVNQVSGSCYNIDGSLPSSPKPWCNDCRNSARKFPAEAFTNTYITICVDIDGINQGEDPFGYGIRGNGKIIRGARAEEWLEKSTVPEN